MELADCTTGMNFTENQHGAAILEKLRAQKEHARFCDVVFHLDEKEYHAHRNVLAACSPYFESRLKMKEGKEHLNVTCSQYQVFDTLLGYMYTGKVVIDEDNIYELLQLANQFMISKLKGYCSEYLERSMHIGSVFRIKEIAEKCGLPQLAKTADAFIYANLIEIIEQEEILRFSPDRLENLLSHKSNPMTEDMRLHVICRWVQHDTSTRQYTIQNLLAHVRWERINIQTLYNSLGAEHSVYLESDWCMFQILQCLEECNLLINLYRETFSSLCQKFKRVDPLYAQSSTVEKVLQAAISHQDTSALTDMLGAPVIAEQRYDRGIESMHTNSAISMGSRQTVVDNVHTEYNEMNSSESSEQSDNVQDQTSPKIECASEISGEEKGGPIKVTIPISKIKLGVKLPKKRGRPPKAAYKKKNKRKKAPEHIAFKKEPTAFRGDSGGSDGEECHKEPSDDEQDNYVPSDDDNNSDAVEEKTVSVPRKSGRKRKKKRGRRVTSPADKINCPKCYFITSTDDKMEAHILKAHKDDTTFQCGICEFTSKWNKEYYQHMKGHFSGPPYTCDHMACEYAADRIQPLLYHRMIHTDERPFACTICNLKFRTRNNLTTHVRCHTGEKPFVCEVCQRRFATKGTMEQHMVTHSDHRPYLCDTCGFSTKYQSHLIAHKRIHTGDVFRCQYPSCNYFTPKRSQLACHMRSHMDIRQHICSVCGRGFVEKSHLVRHERIHLEEKPFQCDQCDYCSTRRDKLKEHQAKHHGESPSAKVPYKPRKPRKQAFNPQAYPGLSQLQPLPLGTETSPPKQPSAQPSGGPAQKLADVSGHVNSQAFQYMVTNVGEAVQSASHPPPPIPAPNEMSGVLQTVSTGTTTAPIAAVNAQSTVDARSIGLMIDPRNINLGSIVQQPLNLVQQVHQQRAERTNLPVTQGYPIGQNPSQTEYNNVQGFMGIF